MKHIFRALAPMLVLFIFDIVFLFFFFFFSETYWASSILMHFLGGIAAGWSLWRLLSLPSFPVRLPGRIWRIYMVWSTTALIVVGWEWYEFILDRFFGSFHQLGLSDTMFDMALGLFGSGCFCIYLVFFAPTKRS